MTASRTCLAAFVLVLAAWLHAPPVQAQQAPSLQSPETFLGYALGEQFTSHHHVMDYVQHVAEQSPNVTVQQYGTTYEGRQIGRAHV